MLTLQGVRTRLRTRPIKILTADYIGVNHRYDFSCDRCDHTWSTKLHHVLSGHGCRRCSKHGSASLDPDIVRTRLTKLGLTLIEYKGCKSVTIQCPTNHVWTGRLNRLKNGCPQCRRSKNPAGFALTETEVNTRLAAKGIVLTHSYKGTLRRHSLRCGNGHTWQSVLKNVLYKDGCPSCNCISGPTERRVREIVERLTGWPFPKAWPKWLRSRSKYAHLSLDGYNAAHSIAFEY